MLNQLKIGIVGVGMVGTPLKRYLEEVKGYGRGVTLFLYDSDPKKGYADDMDKVDAVFVCVPTPRGVSGEADLSHLGSAIQNVAGRKIVIIKSTVPPGTTEYFQKKYSGHKFLFNPEFLTEMHAWENMLHPNRQLVGSTSSSRKEARIILDLLPSAPVLAPSVGWELGATEAEIIKYACNMFLTRKVTFANAIFDIAQFHGADYENIRKGMASDPRIGSSHLDVHYQGYRGYGGYCFTKDTDALIAHCREAGLHGVAEFLSADRVFNENLLDLQDLTPGDVSYHDHELLEKKLKIRNKRL